MKKINKMYKCGHKQPQITRIKNEEEIAVYMVWRNENPEQLCYKCYCENGGKTK